MLLNNLCHRRKKKEIYVTKKALSTSDSRFIIFETKSRRYKRMSHDWLNERGKPSLVKKLHAFCCILTYKIFPSLKSLEKILANHYKTIF